jgi:mannosyltransferase
MASPKFNFSSKPERGTGFMFATLLALSLGLRLFRINQGLWYDEIDTLLKFVRSDWLKIMTSVPVPNNHILYTILAKISVTLFGEKEWTLRLPALIAGALTPPACFLLFRTRVRTASAFWAGLFMVLSFWMVWFSQDARGYSGLILFCALSQILYLRWLENKKIGTAILYLLCTAAGFYFYFYAGFVIAGQVVFGLGKWLMDRKGQKASVFILPVVALFISALFYLPALSDLTGYLGAKEARDLAGRWLDLRFIIELLKLLSGAGFLWFAIFAGFLFLLGLPRLWKVWPGICLLYLLAGAFLILFTWVMRVFIYPRFLSFLIPFFFLALACGAELVADQVRKIFPSLKPHLIQSALALLVCGSLVHGLAGYYQFGKQGFKPAAEYISRNFSGVRVISFGLADEEFLYYAPQALPWPGARPLSADDLAGKLIVASHPWSWSPANFGTIRQNCRQEKVWPSAGYQENDVYLFRCF